MIGAIIGDIVGSRFEFDNYKGTDFELFTPECSYTDDTICTIAIADAILKKRSYRDSLVMWCNRYRDPMGGYGYSFDKWIDNPYPYESFGNGSAMRVSPVAWAFNSEERVCFEAERSAEVSHNHIQGLQGAECVARIIYYLRSNHNERCNIKSVMSDYLYFPVGIEEIRKSTKYYETCIETVPKALQCVIEANSFEEAIRLAISIGGDSDTIAAIAGSVAEAKWGIPEDIKEKALSYLPEDMLVVVREFTQYYCMHGKSLL